jgi:protein-tyrosine phosphatase
MASREPDYRVLFVCTGNTCRSPMAAGALLHALGAEAGRIHVSSAGTGAWEGQPASEYSIAVAERDGVDLGAHRSRRVTRELLRAADLVLVMEPAHAVEATRLGADPQRTFVLSEWPPPGEPELGISDPFGGSMEAYEECWRRIRHHVERVMPLLLEAARARSV